MLRVAAAACTAAAARPGCQYITSTRSYTTPPVHSMPRPPTRRAFSSPGLPCLRRIASINALRCKVNTHGSRIQKYSRPFSSRLPGPLADYLGAEHVDLIAEHSLNLLVGISTKGLNKHGRCACLNEVTALALAAAAAAKVVEVDAWDPTSFSPAEHVSNNRIRHAILEASSAPTLRLH